MIVDESDERGKFILSGSQKLELMKGMSESLAGRVSITELSGLSLREIHAVKFNRHFVPTDEYLMEREKEIKLYDNLWETIHKGSYPELYDVERDWQEYYSSYVSTYIWKEPELYFCYSHTVPAHLAGQLKRQRYISEIRVWPVT